MRLLGWLFLLFGVAACVVYFMGVATPVFDWTNNWGEGAAWGIRGGSSLLGLLMAFTGKKKSKPK